MKPLPTKPRDMSRGQVNGAQCLKCKKYFSYKFTVCAGWDGITRIYCAGCGASAGGLLGYKSKCAKYVAEIEYLTGANKRLEKKIQARAEEVGGLRKINKAVYEKFYGPPEDDNA